jgi:hypothetical protein
MKKSLAFVSMGAMAVLAFVQNSAHAEKWGEPKEMRAFLFNNDVVTNARDIEQFSSAMLPAENMPWSDSFWPDLEGAIAVPYMDKKLRRVVSRVTWVTKRQAGANAWAFNRTIVVDRESIRKNILTVSQETLDDLSPAEKYDLLMGDEEFTLTHKVIEMLDVRKGLDGMITLWSGVCHGWSPASLNLPRPKNAFSVVSPLGRTINFFPADVRALGTFLWGKSTDGGMIHFKGNRCDPNPKADKNGRLVDPRCFDVNPAFFHILMTNQIGRFQRGFIMNRAYEASVWNQPVHGYKIGYYKVTDRSASSGSSLQSAKIMARQLKYDPFRQYRAPETVTIVGVEANIKWTHEIHPDHSRTNSGKDDDRKELTLHYDLELDANDNIVGGEWREFEQIAAPTVAEQVKYTHPDFVWLTPPGMHMTSVADAKIKNVEWDGTTPVPASIAAAAKEAASFVQNETVDNKVVRMPTPQPLAKVVDVLISLSRKAQ